MDLSPSEEQQALVEVLHDFAAGEIRPAARACEEAGEVLEAIRKALLGIGVAVPVSEEHGGQGSLDPVTRLMVAEELAWGDPGTAYGALAAGVAAEVVERVGTPEQRAELLPPLVAGGKGAVALAERDAGADLFRLETTASPAGDGAVLEGCKYTVPDADAAAVLLVVAGGEAGPSLWRVGPGRGLRARREDKLGLRSARTFKVSLDALPVGGGDRIGGPACDPAAVAAALLGVRLVTAGIALGLARAAVEYSARYAQERTAFGRPIGAFQAISFKVADRLTDVEAARLVAWDAGWALQVGRPDAARRVAAACGQAVAAAVTAADDAVQILGGHGYMRDHPVELWYRDAMTLAALETPWLVGDLFLARAHEPAP
jgi:alkylation response protein AidB-like acyl-CoA dehydrogenase